MSIKAFETEQSFVDFLTKLPLGNNAFFTSYIPSALFEKATIDRFFSKYQPLDDSRTVSDALWRHGKRVVQHLRSGNCMFAIEERALVDFANDGVVHIGVPDYEVSHASRVNALRTIGELAERGTMQLIPGPLPFVFRLVPPTGLLIDVDRNTVEQKVQGLWIEDKDVFQSFSLEAERLLSHSSNRNGTGLARACGLAVDRIERGRLPFWRSTE